MNDMRTSANAMQAPAAASGRRDTAPSKERLFSDTFIRNLWWILWLAILLLFSGAVSVSHGADSMWDLRN